MSAKTNVFAEQFTIVIGGRMLRCEPISGEFRSGLGEMSKLTIEAIVLETLMATPQQTKAIAAIVQESRDRGARDIDL